MEQPSNQTKKQLLLFLFLLKGKRLTNKMTIKQMFVQTLRRIDKPRIVCQ